MNLVPAPDWRYVMKVPMQGTDVAAVQLNLPKLTIDGVYGERTERAVKTFQADAGLAADGVAGIATQRELVLRRSVRPAQTQHLPVGLLPSIAANESGFALAAYARHPTGAGFDLGAYQDSIPEEEIGNQNSYKAAYTVTVAATVFSARLRSAHDAFRDPVDSWYKTKLAGGENKKFRWQLATLSHNWPYAAEGIATRGSIFRDPADDVTQAQWVIDASGGRLRTPREWAVSYVLRATTLVRWGTI